MDIPDNIQSKVDSNHPSTIEFLNFHNPQVEIQHLQLQFSYAPFSSSLINSTCDTLSVHLRLLFSRCGLHRQFIFIGKEP